MYTAGLAPFYPSNLGLWSAYCSAGLALDSGKKPSLCITDLEGMSHLGACQPHTFTPALLPSHYHRHGLHLTRGSRTSVPTATSSKDLKFGIDRILSEEFQPKGTEAACLRDRTSIGSAVSVPPGGAYFPELESDTGAGRGSAAQHHFQDTFPGPYAVLTKDTLPQTYKRKRSWSRAVFSNLQRKGLEKRFEIQKYVTKPDRKQLAAMLGLTDAQVKVWFQNRRMKWRHSKEAQAQKDKEEKSLSAAEEEDKECACESDSSDAAAARHTHTVRVIVAAAEESVCVSGDTEARAHA